MVLGYILSFLKSSKKLKILGFIIILVCLAGIMLTGERSNGLKALIGLLIFISFIDYVKLKNRLFVFLAIIAIFFSGKHLRYSEANTHADMPPPIINMSYLVFEFTNF